MEYTSSAVILVLCFECLMPTLIAATTTDNSTCEFAPNFIFPSNEEKNRCCSVVYENFKYEWSWGRSYLTTFLNTLQTWNCSEFERECSIQTFAYNEFARLTYKKFCNQTLFESQCLPIVTSAANQINTNWTSSISKLKPSSLTSSQLAEPCVQAAMYEVGGFGNYHEVIEPLVPFCDFLWCGFDNSVVEAGRVSVWTCMPNSCRGGIIAMMAISLIFAVMTTAANATVIGALLHSRILHNQAIYRISLALGDLLVGMIVFPTFASSLYNKFHIKHSVGALTNVTGYVAVNGNLLEEQSTVRGAGGLFEARLPRSYIDFVGFWTILSVCVSVYTLVAAGADRCYALRKPVQYNAKSTMPKALIPVLVIWLLSILMAVLPLFVSDLRYGLVASILVSSVGREALILYIVAFAVPLIAMWTMGVASYCFARRYLVHWKSICPTGTTKRQSRTEANLAKTLAVMVGVFTLSFLPAVVVMVTSFFLPHIYLSDPDNLVQSSAVAFNSAEAVTAFILMCNSLWNCFIYSARDKEFRRATINMYTSCTGRLGMQRLCKMLIKWSPEEEDRLTTSNDDAIHLEATTNYRTDTTDHDNTNTAM